jgi:DNA-binding NtrC family response regulator
VRSPSSPPQPPRAPPSAAPSPLEKTAPPSLTFHQLRPSGSRDLGPLRSPHISRRQILLTYHPSGDLSVEQIGRSPLRLDGRVTTSGVLRPGGLIEVENRLVLRYTHRPAAWLRPLPEGHMDPFPFGAADRFGVVGESPLAWELRRQAAFLAACDEHVLVTGPSGSGKELIVQAIHRQSRRGQRPLLSRNAATIPDTLIDAELFGNLRNYPNPGTPERPGLLGEADGGALFLDELGELPLRLQAHLLRVMDRGEYQRLGEAKLRRADLRLLAATNRDLSELKHDLVARFPHRMELPGLDARIDDIVLIARHLFAQILAGAPALRAAAPPDGPVLGLEFIVALVTYPFTTHVRELSGLLWSALKAPHGPVLQPPAGAPTRPPPSDVYDTPTPTPAPLATPAHAASELTREQIQAALDRCGGVKDRAWRELGLRSRFQLHRLLKRWGLD